MKDVNISEKAAEACPEQATEAAKNEREKGLSSWKASFFMIAQMAGAGFLALPNAISETGWSGVFLTIFFCTNVAYLSFRLAKSWLILEERWEEYRTPNRQPYMDIAYRSFGVNFRRIVYFCINVSLAGSTIVYIILIAQMMESFVPAIPQCGWCIVVAAVMLPMLLLESPKDFWQASVLAVAATLVAVFVILVKLLINKDEYFADNPTYPNPSLYTFSLGFGAIIFSFGGSAVMPTIQNDMRKRENFWKSIVVSFAVLLAMYLPIGITGYLLLGSNNMKDNILLVFDSDGESHDIFITVAIAMQIINLIGTFVITLNPVLQAVEDSFGVPRSFSWQRILTRSSILFLELLIALAVPNFGLVMNLIGGSTMSFLGFVFPAIMYMKLVDDKSEKSWPERSIHIGERIYLWILVIIGGIGGATATVTSLMAILQPQSFQQSCFVNFIGS